MSQTPAQSAVPILVLCRDLMFTSKITSSAKAIGVQVKLIRDPTKLAESGDSKRIIVDLSQPGFLEAAAAWKRRAGGHVTGFIGHTDTEAIARAHSLCLDAVFTRGAFTAQIDTILSMASPATG